MIRAIRQSFSHPSSTRLLPLSLSLSTRFHPPPSECLALTEKDEARVPRVFAGRWKRPAFSDLLSLPAQSAARSFPSPTHLLPFLCKAGDDITPRCPPNALSLPLWRLPFHLDPYSGGGGFGILCRERERKGEGESFSGGVQSVGDARNKKEDLRRNWKWNFFSFKPSSVRSFNMYLFDDIRLGLASFLEEEHEYLIDYQFKETSILF